MQYTVLFCNQVDMATCCMVQVDILVNNAGLALGTAGVHQNDFTVFNSRLSSETVSIVCACHCMLSNLTSQTSSLT